MTELFLYIYIAINGLAILVYAIDKFKAVHQKWRIPEKHLLLLSLFGPIGALIGMLLLRHKIRKPKFTLLVPLIILLHLLAYFYIINSNF